MNKGFWMPNGDVGYDSSSRIEPKRAHHWFMDASEPELLCNKKQALEALNGRPMSGFSNANVSLWENTSSFQSCSGGFSDRLFGAEPIRTFSLAGQNISSVGARNSNMEIRAFEDQSNDSSISLTTAPAMEDHSSCANYGIRKVKVSQVQSSAKDVPVSMGHSYNKTDNCKSLTPSFNDGIGPTFNKADGNFISMGPNFNKEEGDFMLMGYNFNKGDEGILSMSRPFEKANGNFILMDQRFEKEDDYIISMGPAYNKGHENFFPMGISYNRENEKFISVGPAFEKGNDKIILAGPTPDKVASTVVPIGTAYDSGESSLPSMAQDYDEAEGANISVGSFQNVTQGNNPSGMIISNSYDLLMNQPPEVLGWKNSIEGNADQNVTVAPAATSKADTTRKNKEPKPPKKTSPNSFPSNVKSLLSTGILDGVPVKYVSWGRDKSLRALIKGSSYMCGCNDCKLLKALNAYEFERHAGCKTKHPNNHIYFENGKTIYAVVQELKNSSQDNLFEAIETVTGSPINEKNFRIWKASYQAATRELQRIYGKDEVVMPSS